MAASDAAILKATGHARSHWHAVLDRYGLELDHTERARRLAADHPDLPGWWCQHVVVDFEQARGLRQPGQGHAGDFQVSCSRTLGIKAQEAWRLITTTLPGSWKEGATWSDGSGHAEVRRVDEPRMLRWFWHDGQGRSTVEVAFQDKGDRTTVVIAQRGLPSADAAEAARARWRGVLDAVAGGGPHARLPPGKPR